MPTIEKTHLYKSYRGDTFLGVIDNVTSEFTYSQQINTAGAELVMTIGQSPDAQQTAPAYLMTEAGDYIVTEAGERIVLERAADIIGPGSLIANDNIIEVWEFSSDDPNGVLVFSGYITTWAAEFGGGEDIEVRVLSKGVDLDDYVIGKDEAVEQVETTEGEYGFNNNLTVPIYMGQGFMTGDLQVQISEIQVRLRSDSLLGTPYNQNIRLRVWDDYAKAQNDSYDDNEWMGNADFALGQTDLNVNDANSDWRVFEFAIPIDVPPNTQLYFTMTSDVIAGSGEPTTVKVSASNENPYDGGFMFRFDQGVGNVEYTSVDIAFKVISGSDIVTASYSVMDPADILENIMDKYIADGGEVTYTGASIEATGDPVSYDFRFQTVLEGVKSLLSLAPEDYFWYVDPATNVLHFKAASATADHVMVLGDHINHLNLEATIEAIRNLVYFVGGETSPGEQLLSVYENAASTARRRLERISDGRVTLQDTADLKANNVLSRNSDEAYRTTITIPATVYDLASFNLGDTIGFAGFQSFIDSLILQIVAKEPHNDFIVLQIGILKPRASRVLDEVRRDVITLQSANVTESS